MPARDSSTTATTRARRVLPPRLSRTHATAANRILLARRDQPGILATLHGLGPSSGAVRRASEVMVAEITTESALQRSREANDSYRACFSLLIVDGLAYHAATNDHFGASVVETRMRNIVRQFEILVGVTREKNEALESAPGAPPACDILTHELCLPAPLAPEDDDVRDVRAIFERAKANCRVPVAMFFSILAHCLTGQPQPVREKDLAQLVGLLALREYDFVDAWQRAMCVIFCERNRHPSRPRA